MSETRKASLSAAVTTAIDKMEEAAFALGSGSPARYGTAVSKTALTAEIAAAIAAARAEGVALGAANMRETCRLVAKSASPGAPPAHERIAALALPTDADAILRAERAKGAEAMRAACKQAALDFRLDGFGGTFISVATAIQAAKVSRETIAEHISALEVLP